ncbi:D-alanyl-D-alanine carboxypeptidase [bacterium]|nr:D-alanyl-D-alanine carboxypeptidase [bacterium]
MSTIISFCLIILQLGLTVMPANQLISQASSAATKQLKTVPIAAHDKVSPSEYRPVAIKNGNAAAPIQAKAALIYDVNSAQILAERNATEKIPVASLAKIVTATIILQNHQKDDIVTIPNNLTVGTDVQGIGVKPGEQFTVHEALRALLVYSAGDMAEALAIWDAGSTAAFAEKMNTTARTWQLQNTRFTNPIGLDDPNQYSSARDLLTLTLITLHSPEFRTIINTQRANVKNTAGKVYAVNNTNELLAVPYIYGVKTGTTANAGETLITLARQQNHEIICIVLNSPNRFQESKNMVDWAFANYIWK